MNKWKKNMVAAAVLIIVCAGIYMNWLYSEDATTTDLMDTVDTQKVMSDELLVYSEDAEALAAGEELDTTSANYFAAVRLSRQQARDNAVNMLEEAMSYNTENKDTESAMQLDEIIQTALSEAQIESLVIAKGYEDCVAYMTNEGISVAVSAPEGGLQADDVALIADIVMSQSDYTLPDIRIVEVQ